MTAKHQSATLATKKGARRIRSICGVCNKAYNDRSGLFRHKKKCRDKAETERDEVLKNMILQNTELQQNLLILANKNDKIINTNNVTINNQTNNLNVNVFLNEGCKNALNFADFIKTIEVSHDDLENNAHLGFVNGISKILMDNLKQLTLHERPIHCTDVKREVLYIKDDNIWQKEDEIVQNKINHAIQEISKKSLVSLLEWKQTNPEYENLDSEFSNKCITIQQNSLAGSKKNVYYPKVIHNLAKENTLKNEVLLTNHHVDD
jgi:hypothetical protein